MLAYQLGLAIFASLTTSVKRGDFIGAVMAGPPVGIALGVAVEELARRHLRAPWPRFLMWAVRGYIVILGLVLFLIHLEVRKHVGEAMAGLLLVVGISLVAVPFLPFFLFALMSPDFLVKLVAMVAFGVPGVVPIALLIWHAASRERDATGSAEAVAAGASMPAPSNEGDRGS
jgi:hypothetical protein